MPSLITKQFKLVNAKNFIEQFSASSGNSLYMFLAKPSRWSSDSDVPTAPVDNYQSYSKLWQEIVGLKRINFTNMVPVVPRINWESNKIYEEYDNEDPNLLDKAFYLINSEYNVYKCIDNNNRRFSSVEPSGQSLNIFSTSDGYKWKYLYTVSNADRLNFLTEAWMPVRINEDVASAAKDGAIEHIKLINGGLDYSVRATVIVEGDGANASITAKQSLGVIYDFTFNNTGDGYRVANAYILDSNSQGRNANIRPIISPIGGHGSNPAAELGAHYVMLQCRTIYNEGFGDFPGTFSYRKLGLLRNPKNVYNTIANVSTLSGLMKITLANVNGIFNNNEFIEGQNSKANAYVVSSNVITSGNSTGNGYIQYMQTYDLTSNYKSFTIGESVLGKFSGAVAQVVNIVSPEVIHDTGEILYVENRYPITKSPDQSENLHLVLEF
jgi:hypothetical protein